MFHTSLFPSAFWPYPFFGVVIGNPDLGWLLGRIEFFSMKKKSGKTTSDSESESLTVHPLCLLYLLLVREPAAMIGEEAKLYSDKLLLPICQFICCKVSMFLYWVSCDLLGIKLLSSFYNWFSSWPHKFAGYSFSKRTEFLNMKVWN